MTDRDSRYTELLLIDDFSVPGRAPSGARWQYFSDRVMGGVSQGSAEIAEVGGRQALRLSGEVSLENNGGFIQAAAKHRGIAKVGG